MTIDRFATPAAFWALAALPVLWWAAARASRGSVLYSDLHLLAPLRATWRTRCAWAPSALRMLSLALLIVALARPQSHAGSLPTPTRGIAIQIVVDRSGSMDEPMEDASNPTGESTKIDVVKRLIRQFVLGDGADLKGRPNDLLGLTTFARYAETITPLTRSRQIIADLAEQTRLATRRGEDGTAIGEGLALAVARLKDSHDEAASRETPASKPDIRSRIVILMTDGQNNAGEIDPVGAAELAKAWGIKVYTIGLGAGARPARTGDPFRDPRRSLGGVDEDTLRRIADVTGGVYFPASDADALRGVYRTIDTLEKTDILAPEKARFNELFTPFALAAGAALLLELALSRTVLRRLP